MGTDPCINTESTPSTARTAPPSGTAEPAGPAGPTPGEVLARLRASPPLVQCLTNTVVQQFTANVLLAVGASPAMDDTVGEAGVFASIASGVLINLGTPHDEEAAAMREAVAGARGAHTPWVLDPVAIGVLPVRTALAHELAVLRPGIVRGNASEVAALAGAGAGGRGTDSLATPDDVADAAALLARSIDGAVAVSGEVDLITDGERVWRVGGGSALLTRVTGGGCALGAVVAAVAGVLRPQGRDATPAELAWAAVCAHALYSVAAERAAEHAAGPGSFSVAFLDQLDLLDPTDPALGATERITSHAASGAAVPTPIPSQESHA